MADEHGNWEMKWHLLVADAWSDADLRKRLVEDPMAVLKQRGITPPAGKEIRVVEDTEQVTHLVLPRSPSEEELSEEQLSAVAGGGPSMTCQQQCQCIKCLPIFQCTQCEICAQCDSCMLCGPASLCMD